MKRPAEELKRDECKTIATVVLVEAKVDSCEVVWLHERVFLVETSRPLTLEEERAVDTALPLTIFVVFNPLRCVATTAPVGLSFVRGLDRKPEDDS